MPFPFLISVRIVNNTCKLEILEPLFAASNLKSPNSIKQWLTCKLLFIPFQWMATFCIIHFDKFSRCWEVVNLCKINANRLININRIVFRSWLQRQRFWRCSTNETDWFCARSFSVLRHVCGYIGFWQGNKNTSHLNRFFGLVILSYLDSSINRQTILIVLNITNFRYGRFIQNWEWCNFGFCSING